MKPIHLVLSAVAFVVTASIVLAIIRSIGVGQTPIAFVAGAIIGTQTGAILHARQPNAAATWSTKLILGAVLAVTAVVLGLIVYASLGGITYPEVTLPISAVGAFGFPLVLFNQMFNAMQKTIPTNDS